MKKVCGKQILFRLIMLFIPICFFIITIFCMENLLEDGWYDNFLRYSSIDLGFTEYWESPDITSWPLKADKEAGLYGIRGGDNLKTQTNKQRILCIGDSFTYGFLLDRKDSFPYILESKLGKEKYEVLNAGYPGLETTQEYDQYKNILYKLNPDIVILQHYANDIEVEYYWKIKKQKLDKKYKDNFLYKKFITFRFICTVVDNFFDNYSIHIEKLYVGDRFLDHADVLLEFKQSVEKNGTKFVLLLIPSISYNNKILQAEKEHTVMVNFCKENNINYIDPSYNLFKYKREEIILNKYDIHFNKTGNQILSDIIYSYLMKSNIINKMVSS